MTKKEELTELEHHELATQLRTAFDIIQRERSKIHRCFGKSRAYTKSNIALESLLYIRNDMDNDFCQRFTSKSPWFG